MNIKSYWIAPYPAMKSVIQSSIGRMQGMTVEIREGNLGAALPVLKEAEAAGADVIVSRGGTAKLLKSRTSLPVIDIHISGYDVLRAVTVAEGYPGRKAIVGFSGITAGARVIVDLLGLKIELHTVEDESEVTGIIGRLKEQGIRLVMGDVVTVNSATGMGLESILIQSGAESILDAYERAKDIQRLLSGAKRELAMFRSAMAQQADGAVILNEAGEPVWSGGQVPVSGPAAGAGYGSLASSVSVRLAETEYGTMKVTSKPFHSEEEDGTLLLFEKLREHPSQAEYQTVHHPPVIIAESDAMQKLMGEIEERIGKRLWVILGERGTGRSALAAHIHYRKHQDEGLMLTVPAEEALMQSPMDRDIRTVCLTRLGLLTADQHAGLAGRVAEWMEKGLTVILAAEPEFRFYHAYGEAVYLNLPPLRERSEDIRALAAWCVARFHQDEGSPVVRIGEDAEERLSSYPWPGNGIELTQVIRKAVRNSEGAVMSSADLECLIPREPEFENSHPDPLLTGTLEEIERTIIERILEEEQGNQTKTAKRLGINRTTLWRKLRL